MDALKSIASFASDSAMELSMCSLRQNVQKKKREEIYCKIADWSKKS